MVVWHFNSIIAIRINPSNSLIIQRNVLPSLRLLHLVSSINQPESCLKVCFLDPDSLNFLCGLRSHLMCSGPLSERMLYAIHNIIKIITMCCSLCLNSALVLQEVCQIEVFRLNILVFRLIKQVKFVEI